MFLRDFYFELWPQDPCLGIHCQWTLSQIALLFPKSVFANVLSYQDKANYNNYICGKVIPLNQRSVASQKFKECCHKDLSQVHWGKGPTYLPQAVSLSARSFTHSLSFVLLATVQETKFHFRWGKQWLPQLPPEINVLCFHPFQGREDLPQAAIRPWGILFICYHIGFLWIDYKAIKQ